MGEDASCSMTLLSYFNFFYSVVRLRQWPRLHNDILLSLPPSLCLSLTFSLPLYFLCYPLLLLMEQSPKFSPPNHKL
jgi:hypothetical protein